jgi:hypothetical protein
MALCFAEKCASHHKFLLQQMQFIARVDMEIKEMSMEQENGLPQEKQHRFQDSSQNQEATNAKVATIFSDAA